MGNLVADGGRIGGGFPVRRREETSGASVEGSHISLQEHDERVGFLKTVLVGGHRLDAFMYIASSPSIRAKCSSAGGREWIQLSISVEETIVCTSFALGQYIVNSCNII